MINLTIISTTIIIYSLGTSIFSSWIASKKGYNSIIWFLLGLFFGILALLAISAVSDKTKGDYSLEINRALKNIEQLISEFKSNEYNEVRDEPNILNSNDKYWTCDFCSHLNLTTRGDVCKRCKRKKSQ